MAEPIGVMVCGHGSRDEGAVAEFAVLADRLRGHFPEWPLEHGYLEFARPVLREGLDRLVAAGARDILAVPGMLFAAGHAKNDIPSVLNAWAARTPDVRVRYGRDLGLDPKMLRAAGERIRQALDKAGDKAADDAGDDAGGGVALSDTLLVVVGRGASDPDANANVTKVMRLLWEGFGFGWGETAYSGVTFPLVEPALERAARLGFRRIVVFPYFLFTGILVERIYEGTDRVAARHPAIEFVKAPYLNDHPLVVATFAERVREILEGRNLMNCQMCKYRAQVLGFEDEVGLPQASHHHHVEGIGTGGHGPGHEHEHEHEHDHGHGRGNGHDHRHDHPHGDHQHGQEHGHDAQEHGHPRDHTHHHAHGHHPYPHADHPLGPRSMKGR